MRVAPPGDFAHPSRRRRYETWQEAPTQSLLGAGKYAQVFRAGPGAAVKVVQLQASSRHARRQAFREHVVGLLQTLLLAARATPHLPWHFGTTFSLSPRRAVALHMELFEETLERAGAVVLETPSLWLALIFQVLHACAALGDVFGVTHNDAYPRNVLLRRCPEQTTTYELGGGVVAFRSPFLAALTDFGIASGELLGAPLAPEVAALKGLASARPTSEPAPRAFLPPDRHVLHYALRPEARDFYTVLGWTTFGHDGLPPPPLNVRAWALQATRLLDAEQASSSRPAQGGLARFMMRLYDARRLHSLGLAGALAPPAAPRFSLAEDAREQLLPAALAAMEAARASDRQWIETRLQENAFSEPLAGGALHANSGKSQDEGR